MNLFACAVLDQAEATRARSITAALDGALEVIEGHRLALVIGREKAANPEPRAMARWLATLHAAIDIIPMQYGDRLDDLDNARDLLARREAQLLRTLDAIRGRTEFGIRLYNVTSPVEAVPVVTPGAESASPRDGAKYLRARASHYAALDGVPAGLSTRVQHWLADLSIPAIRARLEGPSPLIAHPALHLLVPRSAALECAQRCHKQLQRLAPTAVLSGPWAPFNFVSSLSVSG